MNPVVLVDEIDKVGAGGRGDPRAVLLEAFDPEQNHEFKDDYLDAGVDLSSVLFVCTANDESAIPQPLLDRMDVVRVDGYTVEEKVKCKRGAASDEST